MNLILNKLFSEEMDIESPIPSPAPAPSPPPAEEPISIPESPPMEEEPPADIQQTKTGGEKRRIRKRKLVSKHTVTEDGYMR